MSLKSMFNIQSRLLGLALGSLLVMAPQVNAQGVMNASPRGCNDINGATVTKDNQASIAGYDATKCGNGVLDPGECCDLGVANNKAETAGNHPTGCLDTCLVAPKWNCNTPQDGFTGYNTALGTMNDLYRKLIVFWKANKDKCSTSPGSDQRTDEVLSYNKADEASMGGNGDVKIQSCLDYEVALDRFLGYNSSHPIDVSIYQAGESLGFQGKPVNYNNKLCAGATYQDSPTGVNVKVPDYTNTTACPPTPTNS